MKRIFFDVWTDDDEKSHGRSLNLGRPTQGVGFYRQALHYQMREMMDFRKLEYDHEKQLIWWHGYKDGLRTKFTVHEFKAGLAEYQWRLKQWPEGDDEAMRLHTRHGHMSTRSVRATSKAMGSDAAHPDKCRCGQCESWQRYYPPP